MSTGEFATFYFVQSDSFLKAMQIIRLFLVQMLEELRQAFRLYDKEQHGYISTMILKVRSWKALEVCQQQMA